VSFSTRKTISTATDARRRRWAHHGNPNGAPPSGQLDAITYAETPMAAANERIVRTHRRGVTAAEGEMADWRRDQSPRLAVKNIYASRARIDSELAIQPATAPAASRV
jgi:hypothetical protein